MSRKGSLSIEDIFFKPIPISNRLRVFIIANLSFLFLLVIITGTSMDLVSYYEFKQINFVDYDSNSDFCKDIDYFLYGIGCPEDLMPDSQIFQNLDILSFLFNLVLTFFVSFNIIYFTFWRSIFKNEK